MRFCPQCGARLEKHTPHTGAILFQCKCLIRIEGGDDDTLMDEGHLGADESDLKHIDFTQNSPFDPAGYTTMKDCLKCKLPYLTMIRIGANETTLYTCTCGFQSSHDDYAKNAPNTRAPGSRTQPAPTVSSTNP